MIKKENYKEFILGEEGVDYVKKNLSDGQSLSKSLLKSFNFESCEVRTTFPDYVTFTEAMQFESGGKLKIDKNKIKYQTDSKGRAWVVAPSPDLRPLLVNKIKKFLSEDKNNVCIFEDESTSPDFPYVKELTTRFLIYNDKEVYHMLLSEDDKKLIKETINISHSWLFVGLLTQFISENLIFKEKKITLKQLETLSHNAKHIIVGAYDGESDLICSLKGNKI